MGLSVQWFLCCSKVPRVHGAMSSQWSVPFQIAQKQIYIYIYTYRCAHVHAHARAHTHTHTHTHVVVPGVAAKLSIL